MGEQNSDLFVSHDLVLTMIDGEICNDITWRHLLMFY